MQENEPNSLTLVNDLHVAATAKLVEALVQSENRMRLRLDLLSEVVFEIDENRVITFLNKAWLGIGGTKIEAMRGKALDTLFLPEDWPMVDALLAATGEQATGNTVTCRIARPDRLERWVEVGAVAVGRKGWVGTMRDVTDAKRSLEQMQLLSLVANYTDNFVIITDARGLVRWVNRSFVEFTGYGLDEISGRSPGSFLQGPDTDRAEVQRLGEHIRAQKSVTSEVLNYTRAGMPYWVTIHLTPIFDDDGALESYIAVQSNTTAMHALYEQIAEEKTRAESANEAKSQFLSNISHEIRTPLNAVIGFLNLLGRTGLDSTQSGYIDKMGSASRHLLRLINDILDFSKVEARMMEVDSHPFVLGDVVHDVADILIADCEAKGLLATVDAGGLNGMRVIGDSQKLRQVLLNLAGNAVKFTAAGQVRLVLAPVPAPDGRIGVTFSVSDTGIGLQADQIDHIFKEFSQAEASTTRRFGGTGLGLAISQRLVNLMGGQISVESVPERGSTFRFALAFDQAGAAVCEPVRPTEAAGTRLAGLRLLVVEDNEINQMVARDVLNAEGAFVTIAGNGRIAVDAVLAAPEAQDLVLMDLQMPVMDGFDATRLILARYPDLPVIAMTANTAPDDIARTKAAGMRDHIGKPFDVDALVDTIRRHARHPAPDPLARLRGLLQASDMEALAVFAVLRDDAATSPPAWIDPVGAALDMLDFDAALAALSDLQGPDDR